MFTTQLLCGRCYVQFFINIVLVPPKPHEVGNTLGFNSQSTVLWFPARFLFQSRRNKMAFWNCYKVSPPETTTWILLMPKRKSWLPASDYTGNLPKSWSSEPNSSWSFMHGSNILVGTLQLARSNNVNISRDSFSWIVFSNYGLGLCSHFWQFWESICWLLRLKRCL